MLSLKENKKKRSKTYQIVAFVLIFTAVYFLIIKYQKHNEEYLFWKGFYDAKTKEDVYIRHECGGKWTPLTEIGRGQYGIVYKVCYKEKERDVKFVMKQITLNHDWYTSASKDEKNEVFKPVKNHMDHNDNLVRAADKTKQFKNSQREAIQQEFFVLLSLQHTGITPAIYDYYYCSDTYYIIMEHLEPIASRTIDNDITFSVRFTVENLIGVKNKLILLYRYDYLHVDAHYRNFVLDQNGEVKIIDFGRAINIKEPKVEKKLMIQILNYTYFIVVPFLSFKYQLSIEKFNTLLDPLEILLPELSLNEDSFDVRFIENKWKYKFNENLYLLLLTLPIDYYNVTKNGSFADPFKTHKGILNDYRQVKMDLTDYPKYKELDKYKDEKDDVSARVLYNKLAKEINRRQGKEVLKEMQETSSQRLSWFL